MAGQRQPIQLLEAKGKKHLTKSEIEERKRTEIKAPADTVSPPNYLSKKQATEFKKIADELVKLEIMSNLDCNALANYIVSLDNYIKFTELLASIPSDADNISALEKAVNLQDKAFKQCRAAASDLGLTISSRCKLVVPKKEEAPKQNKFASFGGAGFG